MSRARIAELLREELKGSTDPWWCITFDPKGDTCILLPGAGPTDAWVRMHVLNVFTKGRTETHGPIDSEVLKLIPENLRLVRVARATLDEFKL